MSSTSHTGNQGEEHREHAQSSSGSAAPRSPVSQLQLLTKDPQFYWFLGHVFILLGTFFYALSSLNLGISIRAGLYWYRQTYFLIISSFVFILYSDYIKLRIKHFTTPVAFLYDANVQYLIVSILWFIFAPFIGTLPPFAIFSFSHVLSFLHSHLLPALGYSSQSGLSVSISNFLTTNTPAFMSTVANIELFLLVRLTLALFTFRLAAFIKFAVFLVFFRLRYQTSVYTYRVIQSWEVFIDRTLSNPNIPIAVKEGWITFKGYVRNIFGTLLGGPTGFHAEEKNR
ncbi:uncharacterized protein SAPINGB_P002997 [Magnusiomyces paraingens]|uniref:Nucleoporin POM33 n=1 Tax=Magnusiomyces paraingens TaxID=2606893 RepID=A0A5E8BHW9_9ASCO|nr:uncharacterized protein SAPINGB_P002997 [Saprochaete ingens]VVT51140.1 unnamed protein product [Saprochaete ingens]